MHQLYVRFAQIIQTKFEIDARYFLSGGFWLLVAQGTTVVGSLITTVLLTRLLSENDFGIYRYVIGLGIFISAFSLTGITQSILQASAKGLKDFLRFSTRATFQYSVGIVTLALLGAVYYFINENKTLALGCLLIALLQPFQQLFLNILADQSGKAKFKVGAQMQTYKSLLVSGTTLLTLLLTQDLLLLLATYFISQALSSYLIYRMYRPKTCTSEALAPETKSSYLLYAKHTSLRNLIIGTAARLDAILIFQQLGAASLALYSVATIIPDHIKGSFKNIQTLIIPKYTRQESLITIKKSIPKRSVQFFIALVALSIAFALIAPYFYKILFPGYSDATALVQLLALSFPASIYLIPLGAMQAHQLEHRLYLFHSITSVMQIGLVFGLLLMFGLMGAVWARIIGQYINVCVSYGLLFIKIKGDIKITES